MKNKKEIKKAKKAPALPVAKTRPTVEMFRLNVGDVLIYEDKEQVVWLRNESRAAICPLTTPSLEYRVRKEDGKIQFNVGPEWSEDISPNSESKLVRSLGREGLAKLIDERQNSQQQEQESTNSMSKNKKEKSSKNTTSDKNTKPAAKAPAKKEISAGKLGGWKGCSVTSVLRLCGALGWSIGEIRQFCKDQNIDAAENTMKIQRSRGVAGIGDPADIAKKTMEELRPELPEKPAKESAKPAKGKDAKKSDKESAKGKDKGPGKGAKKAKPAPVEEAEEEEVEEVESEEEETTE